jgi:hypothetical protein
MFVNIYIKHKKITIKHGGHYRILHNWVWQVQLGDLGTQPQEAKYLNLFEITFILPLSHATQGRIQF